MNILRSTVFGLDRLGLRRIIAPPASALRRARSGGRQSFSVSTEGHWINRDSGAVIVSPEIHTAPFAAYRNWVLDNWAWGYRPKAGDVVVDIGAGVGEESVIFSGLVGATGRVISVEAHPRTFECLARTISMSNLTNVEARCCAIAETDGTVDIDDTESFIGNSIIASSKEGLTVPSRSIDSLCAELGIDRIDLLRMNIEGAERLAVAGMEGTSRSCSNIVISCHDFLADAGGPEQFRTFEEVKGKLEQLGFALRFRPDHPDPWGRYYVYGHRTPGRQR